MKNFKFSFSKDAIAWYLERYGPRAVGLLAAIVAVYVKTAYEFPRAAAEKVLDATITLSSIIVGFVGVLLGILFSIRNTETVELLFKNNKKLVLKSYFKFTILAGICLVLVSLFMYISGCVIKNINVRYGFYGIWGFLLIYTLSSTYRIIHIIMHIIFSENVNQNKELPGMSLAETEKEKLKSKFAKK